MRCVAPVLTGLLLATAAGCASAPDRATPGSVDGDEARVVEGSPEAVGLCALLNDPSTTFAVLDVDAGLNSRTAKNLIAHRDGKDGIFGTSDDNLFQTVHEIDNVAYVGPSALTSLVDFAYAEGFVPMGSDVLGTWEGVTFTADEATSALDLANTATPEELDASVGLDSRAANAIVDARPIDTVKQLAAVYYVGTSALTKMRDYTP